MPRVRRRRQTYSAKTIRPYASAIGELAVAFNDLHEAFGLLFVQALSFDIAKIRQFIQIQAVWGCVTNDRQKRTMVKEAVKWIGKPEHQRWPQLAEDVAWAVERGHALEEQRNNVLHSPLYQNRNALVEAMLDLRPGEIIPSTHMMNFRAQKLMAATVKQRRSLLTEIRNYRDGMYELAEFLRQLNDAWQGRRRAWPTHPSQSRPPAAQR